MKTYEPAPAEVSDRLAALIKRYHPDLQLVEARIDLVNAANDGEASAVTLNGYPCFAVVRILALKDRAMGRGDAEIVIDRDKYESMDEAERDALLDHELYHLVIDRDRNRQPKSDDRGRPILKIRKHDRQFGWFDEIARRHGENSFEIKQAQLLHAEAGQTYFKFAEQTGEKPAMKRSLEGFKKIAREHGAVISIHAAGAKQKVVIDRDGARSEPTAATGS